MQTASRRRTGLRWDLHVHAAPSSQRRWGNDLELVEAAIEAGFVGFVLKSHHEPTASRALIATDYAKRRNVSCQVIGSATLNPWVSFTQVERALALGAKVVWWPTADDHGRVSNLRMPQTHARVLSLMEGRRHVAIATGHLGFRPALELVRAGGAIGVPVIVTHPLNPVVGLGTRALPDLAEAGALIEVDAYSLNAIGADLPRVMRSLVDLGEASAAIILSSDGGQVVNGNPFVFLDRMLTSAVSAGVGPLLEGAARRTNELGDLLANGCE